MLLKSIAGASLILSCVLFVCMDWALWTLPVLFAGIFLGLFLLALVFPFELDFLWLLDDFDFLLELLEADFEPESWA